MADQYQSTVSVAKVRDLAKQWVVERKSTDPLYVLGEVIVILCDDVDRLTAERDAALRDKQRRVAGLEDSIEQLRARIVGLEKEKRGRISRTSSDGRGRRAGRLNSRQRTTHGSSRPPAPS